MKPIRLPKHLHNDPKTTAEITAVIKNVNGRASEHCMRPSDIPDSIKRIENRLREVLGPKKNWKNVEAIVFSGSHIPNAYRFPRFINKTSFKFDGRNWSIIGIEKFKEYGNSNAGQIRLVFTESLQNLAIEKTKKNFILKK